MTEINIIKKEYLPENKEMQEQKIIFIVIISAILLISIFSLIAVAKISSNKVSEVIQFNKIEEECAGEYLKTWEIPCDCILKGVIEMNKYKDNPLFQERLNLFKDWCLK